MIERYSSYCGPPPSPESWAGQWNGDPVLIAVLIALAGAVAWRSSGQRRQAGWLAVGVLAVAFVSPLCGLTTALFAARAVHHVLLLTVAAPLLAIAMPGPRVAMPVALVGSTAMLWAWHWPPAYDAALGDVAIYWAMQIGLIGGGWLFWSAIRRASAAEAVAGILGGAVQMGFLGALLTFSARPLYAAHAASTVPFGIGPLADQHYAGLIMWVPGMLPYAVAAAWLGRRRWMDMARGGAAA